MRCVITIFVCLRDFENKKKIRFHFDTGTIILNNNKMNYSWSSSSVSQ